MEFLLKLLFIFKGGQKRWFLVNTLEALTLLLGITLPIAKTSEFWIFEREFSLLTLSFNLVSSEEWLLAIIVILFGVILPIFKIGMRFFDIPKFYRLNLHKFSMVDIFLLSFLVYSSKISKIFDIELMIGFYFLLISIMLGYLQIFLGRETVN